MKYVKIFGLLAVLAAAMMAFAASASADTVTTTTAGGIVDETPTIHAVNEGTHVKLANPIANIECHSTVTIQVTEHKAGQPVFGHIEELIFNTCTNSWHVTTQATGTITLEASNGEMKSSGAKVDTTRLGVTCVYETKETKVGTATAGNPATLHIEASIPINSGESSGLCGSGNAKWEGFYVSTEPLHFDNN